MAELTITYEGEPVADGQMDAAVLGGALLALADLLNASNRALNGNRSIIKVDVKADFKKGSFGVESVVQMVADNTAPVVAVLPMIGMSHVRSAGEIVRTIFGMGTGLVDVVRKLKGKEVLATTQIGDTGGVKVEVKGSPNSPVTVFQFSHDAMTLHGDAQARLALQRMLAPLQQPGMKDVKAEEDGEPLNVIQAEEVPVFAVPPDLGVERPTQVWDGATDSVYEVVALSFYSKTGWKLAAAGTGGKDPLPVTIEDQDFLNDIPNHRFERGLALRVTLRTIAKKNKDGRLVPKYVVEKVHQIIPFNRPTQTRLP